MWTTCDAAVRGSAVTVARKGDRFSIPQEVAIGDTISVEGKQFLVESVENIAHRSEVWLVSTKEVLNDKPAARRTQD
jgi:hypothetical protein